MAPAGEVGYTHHFLCVAHFILWQDGFPGQLISAQNGAAAWRKAWNNAFDFFLMAQKRLQ